MPCQKCGKTISKEGKFCEHCGAKLQVGDFKKTKVETSGGNLTNEELLHASLLISEAKKAANKMMLQGAGWILVGGIITLITYSVARPGGTYYVFWGLSIYGIYQLIRGVYYYFNPSGLIKKAFTEAESQKEKDNAPK